ncbi:E3 ubiquitin-protein ligase DMA2 [Elsinoe australis]|uniref:RING-type E3 ubiquitin transferase n=1 Tax=Elsinoe australis TaxID=40998 RepID=A0A4U7AUY7_9PEZI|nr:E3 ubiquitin-protein ligase DMA2 [Elsinoe australis]
MTRNRAETLAERGTDSMAETSRPTNGARSMSADAGGILAAAGAEKKAQTPTIRLIPHREARSSRPSLTFPIISRNLPTQNAVIRVGRYSERDNQAAAAEENPNNVQPVGFKSKVVSRRHCEFWCSNNQWYIRDVKSSSGTFLNHVRLSAAGTESRPYPVNDGDIVQLGIDFKGGEEVIFRCVKMRVECNRSWQKGLNQFNTQTHKRLRNLASASTQKDSDTASVNSSECAICLNPVAPCQALFVAPCSHVWHYKCIRTLIYPDWPSFQCPNCRAYADLEADVEPAEIDDEEEDDVAAALRESEQDASGGGSSGDDAREGRLQHSTTRRTLINGEGDADGDEEMQDESEGIVDAMSGTSISQRSPGRSEPVAVPGSSRPGIAVEGGGDPIGARSATPTSTAQFALAASVLTGNEGPLTPRNDAGPFVLDSAVEGSGGSRRGKGRRSGGGEQDGGGDGADVD